MQCHHYAGQSSLLRSLVHCFWQKIFHWQKRSENACHGDQVIVFDSKRHYSFLLSSLMEALMFFFHSSKVTTESSCSLTKGLLPAPAGWVGLTNGAALALGDDHLLAVSQLVALDFVAEDLTIVTHADPAWLWLPDVPVGVHLAVRRAAHIIAWDTHRRGTRSSVGEIQVCDSQNFFSTRYTAVLSYDRRVWVANYFTHEDHKEEITCSLTVQPGKRHKHPFIHALVFLFRLPGRLSPSQYALHTKKGIRFNTSPPTLVRNPQSAFSLKASWKFISSYF